jgi:hypothetical protein
MPWCGAPAQHPHMAHRVDSAPASRASLANATREIRAATDASELAEEARRRLLIPITAIDVALTTLEEINLRDGGRTRLSPATLTDLHSVLRLYGLGFPERLHRSRNGAQLHARMLEWQGSFLSELRRGGDVLLPDEDFQDEAA